MVGKWRQLLHLEPPCGWMNDPNGLCFFGGKYHVYFQYSPDSAVGEGDRGWGHYESTDLLSFEFTGYVIRPDTPEDRDGAFSGSAVTDNGALHIFYTGNVMEEGEHDYITSGRGANVLYISTDDASQLSGKQVLLRNSDYPDFCSNHVRDPKVWREDGKWYMVLGARTLDDKGCVLFYCSDDMQRWEYVRSASVPDMGYMWECPDCFMLDGKRYLSISPQGVERGRTRFQNLFHSGYFRADDSLCDFTEWDSGFDFYAPQTFEAPDGRRILVGWMGIGDTSYTNNTIPLGWQHCLTLPREITADEDGKLLQNPVEELYRLRGERIDLQSGGTADIALPFDLTAEVKGSFEIGITNGVLLRYDSGEGLFSLKFMGRDIGGGRTERLAEIADCHDIRVIADMSSLEIYLSGGRKVLSTRFYPEDETVHVDISGADAEIYPLGKP
ncbi:MAG: glycoside hydrolase family 32 protein [Oscillospiraceae bacterium]|nr:glycoside hydrolase family 32 protein [Oscillospiraceae bacterium]